MKIFPLGYTTTTTAIDNKYESKIEEKQNNRKHSVS